jgi:predicted nucleic acid-binding protein
VLDTQVVLAMWWFADPRVQALAAAVEGATLHWWTTTAMRAELAHVLGRLPPRPDGTGPRDVLERLDRWSSLVPAAAVLPHLRCSDPSDQMFVDLAVERRAAWLLSRDRALLRLRRRAAALGVTIASPEQWPAPGHG